MFQPARSSRIAGARTLAALVSAAIVMVALVVLPDDALAGRYEVVQCDRANRDFTDAHFDRVNGADYGFLYRCEEDEDENSLQIRSITGTPQGRYGRISWTAPPETRIVGVEAEARMRSDAGHQARLSFFGSGGQEAGRIATGGDSPGGFERFSRQLSDGGRQEFGAELHCTDRDGCRASDQARNWIRSVDLTLEDRVPPAVVAGGSLAADGWKRGGGTIGAVASDMGSGVRSFDFRVNGIRVDPSRTLTCSTIAGTPRASRLRPCPSVSAVQADVDTTAAPFADGANAVRFCASDFGSGATPGCVERTVMVDNSPPEVVFAERDREDPELIRVEASDRHSGMAGGSIAYRPVAGGAWRELPTTLSADGLSARVDSLAEPKGRYAFRAAAADRAGNLAVGTRKRDGSEMVLDFPLREAVRLTSSIDGSRKVRVGYGDRPVLGAVLRGPAGPLGDQQVDVVERFAPGSSLEPVSRTARTDARGRVRLRLTRGPSRKVSVRFDGTRRYRPAESANASVRVRGSATLDRVARHVRAGRRVAFHGAIGALGASIPRGKLVELQVRGGGVPSYRTVGRAFRTNARGQWRFRYRFDRFYERPTRYRFRLKVSRERSFPYLTPAFSKARRLTVQPRG